MRVWLASVVAFALLSSLARADQIVYQTAGDVNNLYDLIAGDGLTSYGDEINLGGTAREITSISIPFILVDLNFQGAIPTPYQPNLTLTLYQDNGSLTNSSDTLSSGAPVLGGINRPGTIIATSNLVGPTFEPEYPTNDERTLTFTFPDVLVPSTFSFAVTQNNEDGSDGSYLFAIDESDIAGTTGPPMPQLVGSHNGFVWEQDGTTGLFEATPIEPSGNPNIAVQAAVTAVPEPSSFALFAAAAAALVVYAAARRRNCWSSAFRLRQHAKA